MSDEVHGLKQICPDGKLKREALWVPDPAMLPEAEIEIERLLELPRVVIDLKRVP